MKNQGALGSILGNNFSSLSNQQIADAGTYLTAHPDVVTAMANFPLYQTTIFFVPTTITPSSIVIGLDSKAINNIGFAMETDPQAFKDFYAEYNTLQQSGQATRGSIDDLVDKYVTQYRDDRPLAADGFEALRTPLKNYNTIKEYIGGPNDAPPVYTQYNSNYATFQNALGNPDYQINLVSNGPNSDFSTIVVTDDAGNIIAQRDVTNAAIQNTSLGSSANIPYDSKQLSASDAEGLVGAQNSLEGGGPATPEGQPGTPATGPTPSQSPQADPNQQTEQQKKDAAAGGGASTPFGGMVKGMKCNDGGFWFQVDVQPKGQDFIWKPGTPYGTPDNGKNVLGLAAGQAQCMVGNQAKTGKLVIMIGVSGGGGSPSGTQGSGGSSGGGAPAPTSCADGSSPNASTGKCVNGEKPVPDPNAPTPDYNGKSSIYGGRENLEQDMKAAYRNDQATVEANGSVANAFRELNASNGKLQSLGIMDRYLNDAAFRTALTQQAPSVVQVLMNHGILGYRK